MADGLKGLPEGVELRPVEAADQDFLLALYSSTRADELALIPWPDAQKAAFVEMQFRAQDTQYHRTYPDAEFLVVVDHGASIGRLYLTQAGQELRLIDIALLPEHRSKGIGTALLRWLIARADARDLAVSLHVETGNPARRLYERSGFRSVEAQGIHELMRRPARGQLKTAS